MFAGVSPDEWYAFSQEVSEGMGDGGEARNEGSVISKEA